MPKPRKRFAAGGFASGLTSGIRAGAALGGTSGRSSAGAVDQGADMAIAKKKKAAEADAAPSAVNEPAAKYRRGGKVKGKK